MKLVKNGGENHSFMNGLILERVQWNNCNTGDNKCQ